MDFLDVKNTPKDFLQKKQKFTKMLLNYTKTHNITALKTEKEVCKNIKDSIYPLEFMDFGYKNVADIGSGAGFPAICLALMKKNVTFTLYEPIKKKAAFLHLLKAELDLKNVTICSYRIEEETNKTFDLITSRAVTDTKTLLNLAKNITHQTSHFLLYKGSSVLNELDETLECEIFNKNDRNYLFIKGVR